MMKIKRGEIDAERVQHPPSNRKQSQGRSATRQTQATSDPNANFRALTSGNAPMGGGTAGTAERKPKKIETNPNKQTRGGQEHSIRRMGQGKNKPNAKPSMGTIQSDNDKEDKEMKFGKVNSPKTDKKGKVKRGRLAGIKEKLSRGKKKLDGSGKKLNDKFFDALWRDGDKGKKGTSAGSARKNPAPRKERKKQPSKGGKIYSGEAPTKPDYSKRTEEKRNPSKIWADKLLQMKRDAEENNKKGEFKTPPHAKGTRKPKDKPKPNTPPHTKGKRKPQGRGTKFFHGGKIKS